MEDKLYCQGSVNWLQKSVGVMICSWEYVSLLVTVEGEVGGAMILSWECDLSPVSVKGKVEVVLSLEYVLFD